NDPDYERWTDMLAAAVPYKVKPIGIKHKSASSAPIITNSTVITTYSNGVKLKEEVLEDFLLHEDAALSENDSDDVSAKIRENYAARTRGFIRWLKGKGYVAGTGNIPTPELRQNRNELPNTEDLRLDYLASIAACEGRSLHVTGVYENGKELTASAADRAN
ncbi:hypothetical protein JXB11_03100, partial [Candidatus Woesearchaeota archaeon]|nr:hypothetical protein [Candidatus Woesearchaeota archaeon]